jgi:heterodisulfide reductase subunit C
MDSIQKVAKKPLIDMNKLNINFVLEIARASDNAILNCFQCGKCVVNCPVSLIDERYNPRKILRFISIGMQEKVLTSDFIWLCALCHLCYERCPQSVNIPEIMIILRNLATKEGYIHPAFKKLILTLKEHGRIYEIDEFINSDRKELGLPLIYEKPDDMKKIFSITGLNKN